MNKYAAWDSESVTMSLVERSAGVACVAVLVGALMAVPAWAASAKDGEAVYSMKCKNCHAADGAGNPAIGKMMNVTMKPLGSAEVQAKSDADLKAVVTAGTGKMKPVAGVAPADADNVVAYVRTLKK